MIIINPESIGPCWTYRLALVAVQHLRARGYCCYAGLAGEGGDEWRDIPADDWNDAVSAVMQEIGKAMRK